MYKKYVFVVWCERIKSVAIVANNREEALEKMREQLYDVDMDDACEDSDRQYVLDGEIPIDPNA